MRINLDETSVKLLPDTGCGHLVVRACRLRRSAGGLHRPATRGQTRARLTHIAMICDDADVQRRLPQVLVCGANCMSVVLHTQVCARLPVKLQAWRRDKGWVNVDIMLLLAQALGEAVRPLQDTHQFILLMDVFRAHWSPRVLRALAHQGLWVALIPAKLTWALQPCDTDLFARYKAYLGQRCQELALRAHGEISWLVLCDALTDTVRMVMDATDWSTAFVRSGLCGEQSTVSPRVCDALGVDAPITVAPGLPTLGELQQVFPVGSNIPITALFAAFLPRRAEPAAATRASPAAHDAAPAEMQSAWWGRTRSTSARAHLPDPAAARGVPCPGRPPAAMELLPPPPPTPPFLPHAKRLGRAPRAMRPAPTLAPPPSLPPGGT